MSNKKSPFDRKMSTIDVAEAAGKYFELSGKHILQDLSKKRATGKVVLLIDGMTPQQQLTEPLFNWEAVDAINNLCKPWEKIDHVKFLYPTSAVKPDLFLTPKTLVNPTPILSRESYQALIEELADEMLCDLLQLLKNEYDYHTAANDFTPDEMMRSNMDGVHRYIKVYQRHKGWDAKPKRNLKVMLKRYRVWVMQSVNKEYLAGAKVFPAKHNVVLA
jgi:hypothetical protein